MAVESVNTPTDEASRARSGLQGPDFFTPTKAEADRFAAFRRMRVAALGFFALVLVGVSAWTVSDRHDREIKAATVDAANLARAYAGLVVEAELSQVRPYESHIAE